MRDSSDSGATLLSVSGLTKRFPVRAGLLGRVNRWIVAVDAVDLELRAGETLGCVGESGCGKTSLGRSILRLVEPDAGTVLFHGPEAGRVRDVRKVRGAELRRLRREMQIVFQDPYSSLNPRMRVGAQVGEALAFHGLARGAELKRRVATLLERVGLDPDMARQYPHEFSGGQRQRIVIARALALNPRFVVCDEAVSALDVSIQAQIMNLLMDLQEEFGLAYLFISHDLAVVRHISDRVMVMYLGQVVETGPAEELFRAPCHPYTRALLEAVPARRPGEKKQRLLLKGDLPSPANPPSGCRFHTRCPEVMDVCRSEVPPVRVSEPGCWYRCHLDR